MPQTIPLHKIATSTTNWYLIEESFLEPGDIFSRENGTQF